MQQRRKGDGGTNAPLFVIVRAVLRHWLMVIVAEGGSGRDKKREARERRQERGR